MESKRQFEGCRAARSGPTLSRRITAERKAAMTADILKRKIRNFPVANLNERIATSS
jgi:hypothetical protein